MTGSTAFNTFSNFHKGSQLTQPNFRQFTMAFSAYGAKDSSSSSSSSSDEGETQTRPTGTAFNNPDTDVFLGGLDWAAGETEIKEFFKGCGEVEDVKIPKNPEGRGRGFAFIRFTNKDAAKASLQLSGKEFMGRIVRISFAGDKSGSPAPNRKIFIANISSSLSEQALTDHFAQYGKVISARIVTDPEGNPRGFGFVEFTTPEEATNSLKSGGAELEGRNLVVNIATPKGQQRGGDRREERFERESRFERRGNDREERQGGREERHGGREGGYGGRDERYGGREERYGGRDNRTGGREERGGDRRNPSGDRDRRF